MGIPLVLELAGRRCVIVGFGRVAERKIDVLLPSAWRTARRAVGLPDGGGARHGAAS